MVTVATSDLDYAKVLHTSPMTITRPDGTSQEMTKGHDIYGNDIRSYETLLQTEAGRSALGMNPIVGLWQSLKDNGMRNPLICIGETVEVGNRRLACARALGWETVEVVYAVDRSDVLRLFDYYLRMP